MGPLIKGRNKFYKDPDLNFDHHKSEKNIRISDRINQISINMDLTEVRFPFLQKFSLVWKGVIGKFNDPWVSFRKWKKQNIEISLFYF